MTKALKSYEKAYKDYKRGMSYREIAEKHGVSYDTVKSWKRRHFNRMAEEEKRGAEGAKNAHRLNGIQAAELIQAAAKKEEDGRGLNSIIDSQSVTTLKEMAEVKRTGRPPAYGAKDTGKMIARIGEYFNGQAEKGKPCTKARGHLHHEAIRLDR